MSGIYGQNLLAFSEQFRPVVYFKSGPLMVAGYGPRESVATISAIVQTSDSTVSDQGGLLAGGRRYWLWSMAQMIPGRFVEFEAVVYRLVTDNDWPNEAGFWAYKMEKVPNYLEAPTLPEGWTTGGSGF